VGRTETDAAFSSVWLYGMALGGIGIGELSFNQDVFAGLGSNQIEAYVNAFMLVVAVPVFAHTTGYFLKCRDSIRHTGVRLSVAGVIVVMAGVLSLFLGRERYKLLLGNPLLDPDAGTLVFAALVTFGMYVVGVLLSYMFHDSNSQFRRVCRAFQQARQRRDQEFDDVQAERSQFQAEHDRLRKKIRTDGATGIDGVRNAGRVLADTYREQAASYNECLAEAQALERLTSSRYEEAVQVFRSERGVVRPNDAEPDGGAADVQALRLVLAQVRPVDVSEGLTGDRTEAVERVSADAGHAYQLAAADECQQPAEVQ
jgi:ABC-type transporter MlaC component